MGQEDDDLVLLERVFLGVVMSETDEQFEKIINSVLPSIIQKLSSPSEPVRNKVIELLSHISKRARATKDLQLPVDTLVAQYSDPNASTFIINFTIIYIKIGFPRLTKEKKFELLPKLLTAAVNKPLQHQESILVLLISSIHDFVYPRDEASSKNIFNLSGKEGLKKLLLSIIMDVFMFPYGCTNESNLSEISLYSYRRLLRDGFVDTTPDSIEKLKVDCMRFLNSGLYMPTQEYPALVLASGDARSSVSQLAEDRLKKIFPDIDTNDTEAIALLYKIYPGTDGGSEEEETKRRGVSIRIRLKILQQISKFTVVIWPIAIKVFFESLYGIYTNQKLRIFALNYAAVMIQHLNQVHLTQIARILLEAGFLKLLKEPEIETALQDKTYPLIGQLVRRCPFLVENDLSLLTFMFDEIEKAGESESGRIIRDSAASMSRAYGRSSHGSLPGLLEAKLSSPSQKARSLAINYIGSLPPTPLRTYLLLYATCLSDDEVRREAKKALDSSSEGEKEPAGDFPSLLALVLERETDKPHPSLLLKQIVTYLRRCMAIDSKVENATEPVVHPSDASPLIGKYLAQLEQDLLDSYLSLLFRLLAEESGVVSLSAILEIIGCLYPTMADKHLDKIGIFKKLALEGHSESVKELASELWAALGSRLDPPPLPEFSSNTYALGHLLARIENPPLQYLNTICQTVNEPNNLLSALSAISLIAQSGKLHIPDTQIEGLVNSLLEVFLKNDSNKAREKSILAVAYICIAEVGTKLRSKVLDKLFENPNETKDIEVVLASGQTLVSAILGSQSPLAGDPWTREKKNLESEGANGLAGSSVERILSMIEKDRRPKVRQALCFWLLAVTKHCSQLETVRVALSEIQSGFIDLLTDNNGLTQEGAGKGLALVYEAGDVSTRADLVRAVVDQLGSGKRLGQVSSETKLFEEGELGETPTGEKLSTYKELCTLASDLNQPDLIYKFMALAHHNAIWNSKKGAAFTVASLAQNAGPELEEHLPSVLVKLYRYQYDPISHVRQAMSGIWSSLADKDTVTKYRLKIFDDLVVNLTAREYRVRYSSCRGVADLMRGPAGKLLLEERKDKMVELWSELFRVMDDIHKETRTEATKTAVALSKLCAIPAILPVLLEKGLTNPAAEVKVISLSTINDMLKKGLPDSDVVKIISTYLKLELNPREFVQYVKVGMMEELTSALNDALKHCVRGGRVNAANFITLLSHQLTVEEIQPFVGKFLGALLTGVKDKNRKIRAEFGSTMGHLVRCAKASSVQRLLERLTTLYLESNTEEEVKWGVTEAVGSSIRHSQDAVEEVALPLVFLAKHEMLNQDKTNKKRIEYWEENFKQICPGVGRLTTFQTEIVALLLTAIKSQFWGLKAQGGRGARTLSEKVPELKERGELFAALVEALEGRVWPGKEALLSPLPFLGNVEEARSTLMREAARGNSDYMSAALTHLGESKPPFSVVSSTLCEAVSKEEKKVAEAALTVLGKCLVEENEVDQVVKLCLESMEKCPGACLESLAEITRDRPGKLLTNHNNDLISAIVTGLESRKQATSRRSALNIVKNLQIAYNDNDEAYCQIKDVFDKFSSNLEMDTDPGVRSRTVTIKEKFKERAVTNMC